MAPPRHTHPIPEPSDLSEQQVRGTACVRCGVCLDSSDAVDLGERRAVRDGDTVRWFPRACPQHGEAS